MASPRGLFLALAGNPTMSQIVIRRDDVAPNKDHGSAYLVLVDGEAVASVEDGLLVSVPVSPGVHVVRLQLAWCRSPEVRVNVKANAVVNLQCGTNATDALRGLMYLTFKRKNYLWLREVDRPAR